MPYCLFISAISGERSEPKKFWGVFFFRAKKNTPQNFLGLL
jgi:hypothetical protein